MIARFMFFYKPGVTPIRLAGWLSAPAGGARCGTSHIQEKSHRLLLESSTIGWLEPNRP